MGTSASENSTETIRRMQDNDIACRVLFRYKADPDTLHNRKDIANRRVIALMERVLKENRLPQTVGEWIAVVLHRGTDPQTQAMRQQAESEAQAAYNKALRWLCLLDRDNDSP